MKRYNLQIDVRFFLEKIFYIITKAKFKSGRIFSQTVFCGKFFVKKATAHQNTADV